MSEQVEAAPVPVRAPERDWAHIIIAIGVVLTICYVAELVLAVILVSTLLAFILAPIVDLLGQFRLPRGLSSAIAVETTTSAPGVRWPASCPISGSMPASRRRSA